MIPAVSIGPGGLKLYSNNNKNKFLNKQDSISNFQSQDFSTNFINTIARIKTKIPSKK